MVIAATWLTFIGRHGVARPQQMEHYDKFARDYPYTEDEDEDDSELHGFDGPDWCHEYKAYHSDQDDGW